MLGTHDAWLRQRIDANRRSTSAGIPSICSAHRDVLEAVLRRAAARDIPVLIEATCNQVNHSGGYTGLTPADFVGHVESLCRSVGFARERLMLGGDHLGPSPWQSQTADAAMAQAEQMIAAYAQAGFTKLHLDASMPCLGDPASLDDDAVADRSARLCAVAERIAPGRPVYVIGTEVPTPGGERGDAGAGLQVTRVAHMQHTIAAHRAAFGRHGLDDAWTRVIAVVVQPGVEFGHDRIHRHDPARSKTLGDAVLDIPGIVYEAHSTDYQPERALASLVGNHFAILKVGPELTFALREAVFALSFMEDLLVAEGQRSLIRQVLRQQMRAEPKYWKAYYPEAEAAPDTALMYSYSDRVRYYWNQPVVEQALERLLENLARQRPPLPLISQFLPNVHAAILAGGVPETPRAWLQAHVATVFDRYTRACGMAHDTPDG